MHSLFITVIKDFNFKKLYITATERQTIERNTLATVSCNVVEYLGNDALDRAHCTLELHGNHLYLLYRTNDKKVSPIPNFDRFTLQACSLIASVYQIRYAALEMRNIFAKEYVMIATTLDKTVSITESVLIERLCVVISPVRVGSLALSAVIRHGHKSKTDRYSNLCS
jgi:hypothetical protein